MELPLHTNHTCQAWVHRGTPTLACAVDYRSMDVAFGGEFGFCIRSFWLLFGESSFFKSVVRLSAPGSKAALDRYARRETAC